jgi:hypothetical protein
VSDRAAYLWGLAFGTGFVAFLLLDKANDLARQGGVVAAGVQRTAQREVERVAKLTADQYMGDVYGLTPARIREIGAYASALSGSGGSR